MTIDEFNQSLSGTEPPVCLSLEQKVLWYIGKDNWSKAHEFIHLGSGIDCALIHASIHRKDGEMQKSDHYYTLAGITRPECSFEEEYKSLLMKMF